MTNSRLAFGTRCRHRLRDAMIKTFKVGVLVMVWCLVVVVVVVTLAELEAIGMQRALARRLAATAIRQATVPAKRSPVELARALRERAAVLTVMGRPLEAPLMNEAADSLSIEQR